MRVSRTDLPALARSVLDRLPTEGERAALVALVGNLGAGKTTFAQALAHELGMEESVQSPTYVLMKSYSISYGRFTRLVHIDAYRLEGKEEFAALKPETFLADPHTLVFVEWPEKVEGALPSPDIVVKLSSDLPAGEEGHMGEEERYIEVV